MKNMQKKTISALEKSIIVTLKIGTVKGSPPRPLKCNIEMWHTKKKNKRKNIIEDILIIGLSISNPTRIYGQQKKDWTDQQFYG